MSQQREKLEKNFIEQAYTEFVKAAGGDKVAGAVLTLALVLRISAVGTQDGLIQVLSRSELHRP
jgi:hypothetical protein